MNDAPTTPRDSSPADVPPAGLSDAAAISDATSQRPLGKRLAVWAFRLLSVALIVWIASKVEIRDSLTTIDGTTFTGSILHEPTDENPHRTADGRPAYEIRIAADDGSSDSRRVAFGDVRRRDAVRLADGTRIVGTVISPAISPTALDVLPAATLPPDLAHVTVMVPDAALREVPVAQVSAIVVGRPAVSFGMETLLSRLQWYAFPVVVAAMMFILVIVAVRWWLLARRVGVDITVWEAVKLMAIGMFYTYAPGGITTGDVIKAMYLRRKTKRMTEALVSVFADRLLGLQTMVAMGLVVVLIFGWKLAEQKPLFAYVVMAIAAIGAALGLFILALMSKTIRTLFRVRALLARMPFHHLIEHVIDEVAAAVKPYREAKGTLISASICSFASQIVQALLAAMFGQMLGIDVPLWQYFVLIPVVSIIGAVPGLPGGLGLMEGGYVAFFAFVLSPAELSRALALSLLMRMSMLLKSALGAYWALTFGRTLQQAEARKTARMAAVSPATTPAVAPVSADLS